MATHYICDRCGRDCSAHGTNISRNVDVDEWQGDGTLPPRRENVTMQIKAGLLAWEDDPDLCRLCQIDLLLAVVDAIKQEDTAARERRRREREAVPDAP